MTTQSEFCLRAALCREFATLEPASRTAWLAEADYWARLSKDSACGKGSGRTGKSLMPMGLRTRLSKYLPFRHRADFAEA